MTEHEAPAGEDTLYPVPTNPAWPKPFVTSMDQYKQMYEQSINDPDAFWGKVGLMKVDCPFIY